MIFLANTSIAQTFINDFFLESAGVSKIDVGMLASFSFADIDKDGDDDIYVGDSKGNISVYLNDGSENYTYNGHLKNSGGYFITTASLNYANYLSPTFADLDNDNDLDLFIGELYGTVIYYKNDGNGNFTQNGYLTAGGATLNSNYWSSPYFIDFDGDNDLDLFSGNNDGLILYYRNDAGNYTLADTVKADGANIDAGTRTAPFLIDLDNDNDLDLYVGNYDGYIYIYKNDGSDNFSYTGLFMANNTNLRVSNNATPEFRDADKDGDMDLFVGDYEGNIYYYENDGAGNFSAATAVMAEGSEDFSKYISPTFVDFDNDNDLDLFVGSYYGTVQIYQNDGTGVLTYTEDLKESGTTIDIGLYSTPAFADIDNDNDLDFYTGDSGGKITLFTNDGTGLLTKIGYLKDNTNTDIGVGNYSSPTFADIDKDNDLDLYIGALSGYIIVYENNSGVFSYKDTLKADGSNIFVGNYSTPEFGDIDLDGDLDLTLGTQTGKVYYFLNDGSGNFSSQGVLKASGYEVDIDNRSKPAFANIGSSCNNDLYVGSQYGKIMKVIFDDQTAPEITSSINNQLLIANTNCEAELPDYTDQISATDNCDIVLTQTPVAGSFVSGTLTVKITASDKAGNTDEITFDVEVSDTISPVISCIDNQSITTPNGDSIYTVSGTEFDPTTATDNCQMASVSNDFNSLETLDGAEFSIGTTTVKWTITDDSGNSTECSFDIEIIETPTDINEFSQADFVISPNPAKNFISLKTNIQTSELNVSIYDVSGKEIISEQNFETSSSIDISGLKNGIYIVKLSSENITITKKLVIE